MISYNLFEILFYKNTIKKLIYFLMTNNIRHVNILNTIFIPKEIYS